MEQLKTECETMIARLKDVAEDCLVNGNAFRDYGSEHLYASTNATINELRRIISTIEAYYQD